MRYREFTFLYQIRKHKVLLLMLAPAVLLTIVFSYIPMAGVVIAFKNFRYTDGVFGSPWVGLQNFKFFFLSDKAWSVTRNTFLYNIIFIFINAFLEVSFAVMLSVIARKFFVKLIQSVMFLPFFISWVVVASVMQNVFGYEYGVVNSILRSINVQPVDIYNKATVWPFIITFFSAWKNVGYGTVVYLASITSFDPQMYEAADIDGATVFQKTFKITIPSLTPTIMIMFLLALGNVFRGDFGMFYQLVGNNTVLLPTTDVIDTYVFRLLMSSSDFGMSSAAGFYQSVLCFVTILVANALVSRVQPDYAIF